MNVVRKTDAFFAASSTAKSVRSDDRRSATCPDTELTDAFDTSSERRSREALSDDEESSVKVTFSPTISPLFRLKSARSALMPERDKFPPPPESENSFARQSDIFIDAPADEDTERTDGRGKPGYVGRTLCRERGYNPPKHRLP